VIFAVLVAAFVAQTPTDTSGAYLDAAARRLVAASRARRETIDRSITHYRTTLRERIGVGIRALRRDRMMYRRELALHIDWYRDSLAHIEVLGARQTIPIAVPKPALPDDLHRDLGDYAFDPADDRLTVGWGSRRSARDSARDSTREEREDIVFQHPLAPGSEAHYRFATGDSSVIVFPGGGMIRLRELRIIPRRLDVRLMTGSFWIDEESHAVVRALIRPARPFDFEQDIGDDDDDIPGFVKPIRIDVKFLTIDYGLWAGRWWLPRLLAMDAVASAGNFLQLPMRYERVYDDYEVSGDPTVTRAPRPVATEADDSVARAACHEREEREGILCKCREGRCMAFTVDLPTDTAALLASTSLPAAFGSANDTLISEGELRELTRGLGALPAAPWQFNVRPPRWGLARFNRIEGLSLGARGEIDLGRLRLDGAARIATTDAELDVEGGVVRERGPVRLRIAGYRRLAGVDPTARSLAIGNSLNGLLLGRDDGDYFRAAGAELLITPSVTAAQRFSVRLYAERQSGVVKRTEFSLPHVIRGSHRFRPNIFAERADQIGASIMFRTQRGFDPEGAMWTTDVTLDGATGTFDFGRASGTLRLATPLGRALSGAVELGAGTSTGNVPVQSGWYLGGPATLRGYSGGETIGDAFWRARAEIGNHFPAARIVLFSDVGRAGPRDQLSFEHSFSSVGIGASFMDGLVRIDVARPLRGRRGVRIDFYTDAAL
jgi:hypothetical protein